ncbi:MAG: endonuclease/exonuclease/phosphatase family protein [Clostridium sp.]
MRIATYNVWNESRNMESRIEQLITEINQVDADVIGLQEVTEDFFNNHLKKKTQYQHCEFKKYRDYEEGLAILSKYPITKSFFLNESAEYAYSAALNVLFEVEGLRFSLTNLHLPWASAKEKEEQIVAIDKYMHMQKEEADFFIILGDFNGSLNSSVHRFLLGEQTIEGNEANPYWYEVSSSYAAVNGLAVIPTLDFVKNPRWGGRNTTEIPIPADRIYLMLNYGGKFEENLKNVDIFGTKVSEINKLSASDHYGVVAQIDFIL